MMVDVTITHPETADSTVVFVEYEFHPAEPSVGIMEPHLHVDRIATNDGTEIEWNDLSRTDRERIGEVCWADYEAVTERRRHIGSPAI